MALEWWININGTTSGWKEVAEAYINIDGTTSGWKEISEGWVNYSTTNWGQFYEIFVPDPSFTTAVFRSGVDADTSGYSDVNGCDCDTGTKNYNEWCFQWTVSDCVTGTHQLQCYRDIGGGMVAYGNLFGCTGGGLGWCTKSGYSGSFLDGANGTTACASEVGDKFEWTIEPNGGGTAYVTTAEFTLQTCAAV